MLKKFILWSLFAAFAAILVIGAINRTNAKGTDTTYTNGGNGYGQNLSKDREKARRATKVTIRAKPTTGKRETPRRAACRLQFKMSTIGKLY